MLAHFDGAVPIPRVVPGGLIAERPHIPKDNNALLRDLDEWLGTRGGRASFADVLATGNHLLFAAYLLRQFRRAARAASFDRFRLEARRRRFVDADSSTGSFFFMIDRVAEAWSLTEEAKIELLRLESVCQLDVLRHTSWQTVSPETLERGAILLDIFLALNAMLPEEAADRWIRAPNAAPLFSGKSALVTMIEGGLPALRHVRRYLWAEAAGN